MMPIKAWTAGLLVSLCGCASLPHTAPFEDQTLGQGAIQGFRFSGRLAVHQPSGTETGKIDWASRGAKQHVELSTPLGSTVAQLDQTPQSVHMTLADHSEYWATDTAQLTQSVLGYALPLEGLPWWVLGRADPAGPAVFTRDLQGNPESLAQTGWLLQYGDWRQVDDQWLPGTIVLHHDEMTIRLKVDQWIIDRDSK